MENGVRIQVEFIRDARLKLDSSFILVLENIIYIRSIRQNLIYLPKLDYGGFKFTFGNEKFELFFGSKFVNRDLLCDDLCHLNIISRNEFSSMYVHGVVPKR